MGGRASTLALIGAIGCGPDAGDLGDAYPRNCGIEGPVDLHRGEGFYEVMAPVDDFYLIMGYGPSDSDAVQVDVASVDRCGESEVPLHSSVVDDTDTIPRYGVVGGHLLSCDAASGAVHRLDPAGEAAPRRLFDAVDRCHVVGVAGGLAAQAQGGHQVWFHPDPRSGAVEPITLSVDARLVELEDYECSWPDIGCDGLARRFEPMLRSTGDALLVWTPDDALVEYTPSANATRVLDEGPIHGVDLHGNPRYVFVGLTGSSDVVLDRQSGASFPFPHESAWAWDHEFDPWLVTGTLGPPSFPAPPEWRIFRAHHLPSGQAYELTGREDIFPQALFSLDSILVGVRPEEGEEFQEVIWPATGRRERVSLPGEEFWNLAGVPGVWSDDHAGTIRHLAAVGEAPRVVLQDARVAMVTARGRTVFTRRSVEYPEVSPLSVMLPDETVIELDDAALDPFRVWEWDWPVDRDEVYYLAKRGSDHVLRRTVLP